MSPLALPWDCRGGEGRREDRRKKGSGEGRAGRGGEGRGKKGRRGGVREVYVVCISYPLRATEPTCVCVKQTLFWAQ